MTMQYSTNEAKYNCNDHFRPYLAGSGGDGFPESMSYANADDCDSYVLQNVNINHPLATKTF